MNLAIEKTKNGICRALQVLEYFESAFTESSGKHYLMLLNEKLWTFYLLKSIHFTHQTHSYACTYVRTIRNTDIR